MRDLMRVLEQEKHAYSDPVTEASYCISVRGKCQYMMKFSLYVLVVFATRTAVGLAALASSLLHFLGLLNGNN